jgi:DNA-directed RNA polymerase sigma subunit (sigma70/sigma32)
MAASLTPDEYEARNRAILAEHENGATYAGLARRHDLSPMRIRQIVAQAERKARQAAARQRLVDAFRPDAERMKIIIEHRRAIYDELKATFGWRWRKPSPEITSMLGMASDEEMLLDAERRAASEQKRLQNLYQKTMKAERARLAREEEEHRRRERERKARIAKLTRYLHRKPMDWVLATRFLVKRLQEDFIPDSQHWPLTHLGPDGILWLDQTFRALVRDQYANRGVIKVEP